MILPALVNIHINDPPEYEQSISAAWRDVARYSQVAHDRQTFSGGGLVPR